VSLSCKILVISLGKHQQMSFPLKNMTFKSHKHVISADINIHLSRKTNTQHMTDLVQITVRLEICASCSYMHQDSSWEEQASWLLLIPCWLEATYIFLKTSHLFLLSSSSGLPSSFCYHLLLLFCTSKSWLHKHLSKVQVDQNQAERRALQSMSHPLRHNFNADTGQSTGTLRK